MEQLQLAFEQLQEAWAALIDTFVEIWERFKQTVSDAWDFLCFWKDEKSLEKNSEEQKRIPQSRIEVDSSELFQYNKFAD